MTGLLLPEHVQAQVINDEIEEQVALESEEGRYWEKELKRIDPGLELVQASGSADDPELEPGVWYIRKRIPGQVDHYIPLTGPTGARRLPGAWMLEWLDASDLWNPRVHRDRKEAKRKLSEARQRAKKLRAEQRQDVMAEAVRAARRIRDDRGMNHRSDLKVPKVIAEERKAQVEQG